MPAPKLLLNAKQQAFDELTAARRRTLTARAQLEAAADQADAAWPTGAPPTGQPGDEFLTSVRDALAANDPDTAAKLLRNELHRQLLTDDLPGTPSAERPRRRKRRMSRWAHLLALMSV